MTLRHRLALVLVAFVALIVASAVALTATIGARGDRSREMQGYAVTAEGVARLQAAFSDLEIGQRGFIITGDPEFLLPYDTAVKTVDDLFVDARRRHPDDARLLEALDAVEQAGHRWRTESAEPEISARRTEGQLAAERLASSGQGRAQLDELGQALDRLDALTGQRFQHAADADARLRRLQVAILVTTFALASGLLAYTFIAMRRWVTVPLAAITVAAQAVRDGDMQRAIPVTGPDDVRALGAAVDDMRQRMVAEIDRADRARQAVEQSASIVLQVQAVLTAQPSDIPDGWTAAAGLEAAEGLVAGDCYDIFRLGLTDLAVLVLDIAGHGASAALTALRCKEIVRAALRSGSEPGRSLAALDQVTEDLEGDLFLTGFVAVISHETGIVSWANAGHPPAFLRHGTELIELPSTGPVVGPFPGEWLTRRAILHPGGQLVLYTDGIPEARGSGDFFGPDRLANLVVSGSPKAEAMVAELLEGAKTHADGRLVDDATAVVIARDELPDAGREPSDQEDPPPAA